MATLVSSGSQPPGFANAALEAPIASQLAAPSNLSSAQTGNGASTNIVDRGGSVGPVCLQLTTAIGATPTCTYLVEGSVDGTTWFAIQNADAAVPQTLVITTFVITTAATFRRLIPANIPVRYIRVTYSANTNVTNTLDAYIY